MKRLPMPQGVEREKGLVRRITSWDRHTEAYTFSPTEGRKAGAHGYLCGYQVVTGVTETLRTKSRRGKAL